MRSTVGARVVVVLASLALAAACTPQGAPARPRTGTAPAEAAFSTGSAVAEGVTVAGTGVATGEPDVVRVVVGVEVRRGDVQQALDDANAATRQVLAALDDAGVAAGDRQTRDFAVQPIQEWETDARGGPTVTGYLVRHLVEATVRDVGSVGRVVQAAARAAGDDARVQGVLFDLEDDGGQVAAARRAALDDAREKARQYAALAGASLGALIAIEDQTVSSPRRLPGDAAAAVEEMDAGVPIEPGEHDVSVRVVTRWALE